MDGLFSWPDVEEDRKWWYEAGATNSGDPNHSAVWVKPRGFSMFWFFGMSSGGGGGSGAEASTGHGGPGGGSGAAMSLLLPSLLVPEKLFIKTGFGGAGATHGSNNAVDGDHLYVDIHPRVSASACRFMRCLGGTAGSYGGGANSGGSGGTAGTSGSTYYPYLLGMYQTIAGVSGRPGLQDSTGSSTITWANGQVNLGGLGGAGTSTTTDYKGEGFTGPDPGFPPGEIPGIGGAAGGGNGDPGWFILAPFMSAPGCGGGNLHNGTGGKGGDGGRGSGGGGGGQGTTAGGGGRGGDGFFCVIGV